MYMPSFSLFLSFGALTGLLLAGWRAPKKMAPRFLDAGLGILAGSLLGSRAMAVAVNWGYYQAHPGEIVQVWLGGLSGIGAMAGGVLAVILAAWWLHLPAGLLSDGFLPLAGTLVISAWLGCWVDGCSYGFASSAWWAMPARDEWGVIATRLPVQFLGAVSTLLLVWLLDRFHDRLPHHGTAAALGLMGFSAEIFGLSFLRADPTLLVYGLRLEAWGALGLMLFSLLAVVVLLWHGVRRGTSNGVI